MAAKMLKLLLLVGICALAAAGDQHRVTLYKKPNFMKTMGNVRAERNLAMLKLNVETEDSRECVEELDNYANNKYYGVISLGTPPQKLNALFDTGFAFLYVQKGYYNPNASSTAYEGASNYMDYFSIDSSAYSEQANYENDVFSVAGITLKTVRFMEGDNSHDMSNNIFGLSMSTLTGLYSPLYYMYSQGVINKRLFSFYYAQDSSDYGGQVIFGDSDPTLYNGTMLYVPTVADTIYWYINVDAITYNNDLSLASATTAALDTGFAYIACPISAYAHINAKLGGLVDDEGNYIVDCDSINGFANVDITIGNQVYSITPDKYILRVTDSQGNVQCMSAFTYVAWETSWILGEPFITSYYLEFDIDNKRVGIATPV